MISSTSGSGISTSPTTVPPSQQTQRDRDTSTNLAHPPPFPTLKPEEGSVQPFGTFFSTHLHILSRTLWLWYRQQIPQLGTKEQRWHPAGWVRNFLPPASEELPCWCCQQHPPAHCPGSVLGPNLPLARRKTRHSFPSASPFPPLHGHTEDKDSEIINPQRRSNARAL